MIRTTRSWLLFLALATTITGCEAHGSHHRSRSSSGAAAALAAGALLIGALVDAAQHAQASPAPTTVVADTAPTQAAPARATCLAQKGLPGWVVVSDPPARVGEGVTVTVAGSSGVIIRLQTDRGGRFMVPMPLPEGHYTAFVDDGQLYGRVTFAIGEDPLPPLYLEAVRP